MTEEQEDQGPPFFSRKNWLMYVIPMGLYLGLTSFEPSQPLPGEAAEPGILGLTYDQYPMIYAGKLLLVIGSLLLCSPAWRQWPFKVSWQAIAVGVVGVVAWIAVCSLKAEERLMAALGPEHWANGVLGMLGLGMERPAYNPFEQYGDTPFILYGFLAVRFVGLSIVVPVFEELLLRGWLMRNMVSPEFWTVNFGRVTTSAVVIGTAFPMLYHPEKLASLVWFSMITWLMVRTKNYWDCVAAHAVTNFLLGVYVVIYGEWWLW